MRVSIVIAALLLVLSLSTVTVSAVNVTVGKNVDITASNDAAERQQVEPTIAVDPRNPNIIVAGAQDYRMLAVGGHRWHGYYRSIDGGKTWSVSLLPGFPGDTSPQGLASPLHTFNSTSDPVLAFDRSGNLYYVGITVCCHGELPFMAKFVNDGANYSSTVLLPGIPFADKPWVAVDTSGTSHDGNVYIAFDGESTSPKKIGTIFMSTADGGVTFSQPLLVSSAFGLPGIAVDSQGNVFVSIVFFSSKTGSFDLQVAKSTDGGLSIGTPVTAVPRISFLPTVLPGNLFRTFTIPQLAADNRGVYMVWDDFRTNTSNVMFTRSTDGGATWTSPIVVNDILTGEHFMSSIAVSAGIISVVWYDSRQGQLSNGTITGLNLFYAQSTDAGLTFSQNVQVTSKSFNPNLVERADFNDTQPFIGDYLQVTASPGLAHPIWADNRDACINTVPVFGCTDQDVFTATINTS